MASLAQYIFNQYFDDNGDPLNGGKIYAYDAGTVVDKDTFNSAAGDVANSNPITLAASGRTKIYLEEGSYDFVIKDALLNTLDTVDDVDGANGAGDGSFQIVEDMLALKALPSGSSDYVDIGGYYDKGDGGEGRFYWDSTSSASDNAGTIIVPDSAPSTGRWIRNYDKFIRVEWFGTVADGVTDDTNAIISAIALSQNKELHFGGSGTFLVTAALALLSNTTVRGVGKSLINSTTTGTTFDGFHIFGAADGCKFYNLTGTGTVIDKAGYSFIDTTNADTITIEGCNITGYGDAINLQTSSNLIINSNIITGPYRWGINVAAGDNIIISNNRISGSVNLDGIKINGNIYSDSGAVDYDNTNISILGNIISGCNRDGVDVATGGNNILIQDNNCYNNTLEGIEVKAHKTTVTLQRVVIKDNLCENNTVHGIRLDDVSQSHVTGNTVTNNGDEGILAQNAILFTLISDNNVFSNAGNGIRFQGEATIGDSKNCGILNNRCIDNGVGDNGITLGSYIEEITVQGNQCYQTSAGKTNTGIGLTATTTVSNIKIIDNYCPQDKLDNGSNAPISMGAWSGDGVYCGNNITYSTSVFVFTDGDAIPEVAGGNPIYQTANTAPVNITGFDQNSYEMGEFNVFVNDVNTTFVHGASLVLLGGVNYVAPTGAIMTFICRNNIFREVSRVDSNGGTSQDTTITNDLTVGNDVSVTGSMTFETASEKILVPNAFSLEHDASAAATSELFIKSKGALELHIDSDASTTNAEVKFIKDNTTRIGTLNEAGNLDLPIGGITTATSIAATTTVTGTTGLATGGDLDMTGTSKKIMVGTGFIMEHGSGATASAEMDFKSNHHINLFIDNDASGTSAQFRIFKNTVDSLLTLDENGLLDIVLGGLNIAGQLDSKAAVVLSGTETIAAGGTTTALDLTKSGALIDADAGGDIFTLGGGADGQIFECACLSSTGVCTITPGSMAGGTSVTLSAAGATVQFRYFTSSWYVMGGNAHTII